MVGAFVPGAVFDGYFFMYEVLYDQVMIAVSALPFLLEGGTGRGVYFVAERGAYCLLQFIPESV